MKTQRQLNLEYWGRIHDMCDSHNAKCGVKKINTQDCVNVGGALYSKCHFGHPDFARPVGDYKLAVGIVDNTPVFAGDTVYDKKNLSAMVLTNNIRLNSKYWTLTPPKPKREFELNGKMLPCPSNNEFCDTYLLDILGEYYYFESMEDRNNVAQAINILFNNARDKE